mmetsp:Transcript_44865/g.106686  ORF Transcript_44865/g.106686 Transcript_44865/m.106686 type:complete len:241 (-) Transcript_44865:1423-2145(-)
MGDGRILGHPRVRSLPGPVFGALPALHALGLVLRAPCRLLWCGYVDASLLPSSLAALRRAVRRLPASRSGGVQPLAGADDLGGLRWRGRISLRDLLALLCYHCHEQAHLFRPWANRGDCGLCFLLGCHLGRCLELDRRDITAAAREDARKGGSLPGGRADHLLRCSADLAGSSLPALGDSSAGDAHLPRFGRHSAVLPAILLVSANRVVRSANSEAHRQVGRLGPSHPGSPAAAWLSSST